MKEKPVFPLLLGMGMPMVLSMLVNSLYNIVDSYFVARISENAMEALSLVFPIQNFINAMAIGFGVGINALIATARGAGKENEARRAATQGVVLSVIHGIILSVICIVIMPGFLGRFTGDQEVIRYGVRYASVAFLFSPIIMAGLAFEKIFQAVGRMKVSMAGLLVGCLTNIILDPILIFGVGSFPGMGIKGAALATGIGQMATVVLYVGIYIIRPISVKISICNLDFKSGITKRLYAIGIPAILNMALPSLLISSLNAILAGFSESYVMVLGVYYKLQTFLYLTANGIVQGIRPLVGYNYGAGEYGRVHKIFNTALTFSAVIMVFGTGLCLLMPEHLIGMFTTNTQTIQIGASALRIISVGFAVSSISVTACGALEGLNMGTPSLIISMLRYVILIIPVAFVLSRFLGAAGVWHAFWITEWITAAASWYIYRKHAVGKA